MEPLTIDDLFHLLGQKEAHIAQLQRHIAQLEKAPGQELEPGLVVPIEPNGLTAAAGPSEM